MARLPTGGGSSKRRRKPARKPTPAPRPSATQRARSQQQSYVSQGRAVEKAAGQQRRTARRRAAAAPRSNALSTSPFRGSGPSRRSVSPIEKTRQQAHDRTRRAAAKLPDQQLKHFPLLARYTPRQRLTIIDTHRDELRRIRGRTGATVSDILTLSGPRDRTQLALLRRVEEEQFGRERRARNARDQVKAVDARDTKFAGIPIEAAFESLSERAFPRDKPGLRIAQVPYQLLRAGAEDPAAVAKSSIRTGVESIAGIPQGVKAIIEHPSEGLKAIAKDYEDRYGTILEGNSAEFRRRVKEDYGVTPYVLDAAAAAPPVGQGLGMVARSGAYGRALRALRTGVSNSPRGLGGGRVASGVVRGLEEVRTTATRQRPVLRQFAGEAGAREQATSRNLFVAAGQRGLDAARRAKYEGKVRRAGLEDAGGGRLTPRDGAEQVGRLPGLRPGEGEVLPLGVRETPMLRRLTGRVARDIGGTKSVTRIRLLQRRASTLRDIDQRVNDLSPTEQRALKYVRQLGLPAGHDLQASVRALERRLAQIRRTRKAKGFKGTAPPLRETADDVRAIRTILKDPENHLTARVREIADELRQVTRRDEALDPDLTPERALIRADRPQARLLGVERGPDVEFFGNVLDALERRAVAKGDTITPGTVRRVFGELGHVMPDKRTAEAVAREANLRRDAGKAERQVTTAQRRVAVMRNVIADRERHGPPLTTTEVRSVRGELATATRDARRLRSERDRLMGESKGANQEATRVSDVKYGPDFRREDRAVRLAEIRGQLAAAEQRVRDLRGTVRQAEKIAPRVPDAMHARLAELEHDLTLSRQGRDAARQLHKISRQVTRATKAKVTMRLESAEVFDAKVRAAAEAAGLVEPDYWMSSPRPREERSLAAVGTGGRAAAKSKRYEGKLFDLGIEETGPDALRRGAERNIKRRFSWALTSRNMEVHAFEWSRGGHGEGMTAGELLREFDDRAIDPASVALISPRIARRRSLDEHGAERGRVTDTAADPGLDEHALDEIHQDLREATRRPETMGEVENLANEEVQGQALNRYLVVPREVADELESATRPDGALARTLQIVLNQKPARILLGTLNAPWLMFQIASNAFLTGLGGGRNPLDVFGAHKWWRGLNDAEKEAIEAELGITHGHAWNLDQTQLGAASDKMGAARHLVNFWRGYKKSRVGRLAHKVNPLDLMFRVDEAQNNFFRKTLFYSNAKRAAYRRMGRQWRTMDTLQGQLSSVLGLSPERMGAEIARHGPEFEKHAQTVRDFLGDYLRFSDHERRLLSRNVMFYGYLRFSLRFAFYTMPVQHPIMSAIMGDIGRMGAQEIKTLFGVPSNYRLPTTMVASAYFGDRKDAKRNQLEQIAVGRFNPFLNAVTQLESEQQLVGLVSPIYQALVDQMFEESSFTGRDYRINGVPTPAEAERPKDYYGSIGGMLIPGRPRNRILLRDLLSLGYPYRAAEKTGIPEVRLPLLGKVPGTGVAPLEGPQGDDSLLWSPRPTGYRDPATVKSIEKSIREQRRQGAGRVALDQLLPLLRPQKTLAPQVVQREREKEAAAAEAQRRSKLSPAKRAELERRNRSRAAKKAARTRKRRGGGASMYGGSSSSGSARYGGGSSSSRYGG